MKLTVLVDNNTIIDRYFYAEPALSYYIEAADKKILFDTGYSDIFMKNACKMRVDLTKIDTLVLSHSHLDHTWGMEALIKAYTEGALEGRNYIKPDLIAHPNVFDSRTFTGAEEFGISVCKSKLEKYFSFNLCAKPYWITDKVVFLGSIPRSNDFETRYIGKVLRSNGYENDYNIDDSALCYKSDRGIVIITGCSHSGICNIVEYAKRVCQEDRIVDIIGGFHLQNADDKILMKTTEYLANQELMSLHPSHCTDLAAKIALAKCLPVFEVGVGLELDYTREQRS